MTALRSPAVLYHYTCLHSVPGILRAGMVLRPHVHPLLPELGPVVWLTDLAPLVEPRVIGIDPESPLCDRTEFRFDAMATDIAGLVWWPRARGRCQPGVVADLEQFGWPERWWIAREPVTVTEG
jgi:hypothetical protein